MANSGDLFRDEIINKIKSWNYENLEIYKEVWVGDRFLGTHRKLDIILKNKDNNKTLGIEAKVQYSSGTVDQKANYVIDDCIKCPIPCIIVFTGDKIKIDLQTKMIDNGIGIHVSSNPKFLTVKQKKTMKGIAITNCDVLKQRVLIELDMDWLGDQKSKIAI